MVENAVYCPHSTKKLHGDDLLSKTKTKRAFTYTDYFVGSLFSF